MQKKINILCGAGGTGGHLFPALAVIEQLEKIYPFLEVHFAGRIDKIEGEKIPKLGYRFHPMNIRGLNKLFSLSNLSIPFEILNAIKSMRNVIKINEIDLVICTGSYISYPPGKAAIIEGIPLVLMESNVNPGKSIEMLASKSTRIFTSFHESNQYFKKTNLDKISLVGNPVRSSILNLPDKTVAKHQLGYKSDERIVFVFGGSLGAKSINLAIDNNLDVLAKKDYKVIWQTGKNFKTSRSIPSNISQSQFIDDMALNYAAADLIVSRSGATTVAELSVAGKPSILVPLETASNNEQSLNAKVFVEKGAAIMLHDNQLMESLISNIDLILDDENEMNEMSKNAISLGNPDAAEKTAKEIINLLNL